MTTPRIDPAKRKPPMSRAALRAFQDAVVASLGRHPHNTRYLADKFDVTISAMSKRLTDMAALGLIHSSRVKGAGQQQPYMWYLGKGQPIVLEPKIGDLCIGGEPKQMRVTKWPPVTIPKQGIFAALGL